MLPIFLYKGDKDDLSKQLLEMEVDSQLTVPAFKAVLLAKLLAAEVLSDDELGPEDGSHLRGAFFSGPVSVHRCFWRQVVPLVSLVSLVDN